MKLLWITECILRDNKSWRKNRSLYWLVYDKTKGQLRTTIGKKKRRMRIFKHRIFLSLLAGKFAIFEQMLLTE